jgi:hypothetical protein
MASLAGEAGRGGQCRIRFRRTLKSSGAPPGELALDADRAGGLDDDAFRSSFRTFSTPRVTLPSSSASSAAAPPPWPSSSTTPPSFSFLCLARLAARIRLREAFGVTSPAPSPSPSPSRSGLDRAEDRADRPPSEAEAETDDRVRRRFVRV